MQNSFDQISETKVKPEPRDSLDSLRETVFDLPLLPQVKVLEMFGCLDGSLQDTIDALLNRTNFVETCLADIVAEVAASITHGRTIYGRTTSRKAEREKPLPKPGTPGEVFKRSSDIQFLEQSINILYLLAYYQGRQPVGVGPQKDLAKRILREVKFVRLVYEDVIDRFLAATKGYVDMARRATEAHNSMHTARLKTEMASWASCYSDFHDQMQAIEDEVKVDRAYLYHLCLLVKTNRDRQARIRDTIHMPYLRIVYKEAKRHATNTEQTLDNFQNGSVGLSRAISCYNLDRNVSFSSYSHWWIRQSILFSIKDSSNFVKLPVTTWQSYTSIEKKRAKIASRDGDGSMEALARATGHTEAKLEEIYGAVRSSHVHSLDYEVDETGKMMLIDVIPDDAAEQRESFRGVREDIDRRLKRLLPEQRWALVLHYGMVGRLDQTDLDPIEISRERIRQRIAAAGA